jgi:hypothetical protein
LARWRAGVIEYLSLLIGYRALIIVVGLCYVGALLARTRRSDRRAPVGFG